jgi:nucleoside 2-deoxyribosyltransferase
VAAASLGAPIVVSVKNGRNPSKAWYQETVSSKIYLAGALFTSAERSWNERLAGALRKEGFDVVLPQEEASKHVSVEGVDLAGIFATCLEGIRSANVVVAIFDGVDVDSGTAFECGYAYSKGIPIVGLRTDLRSGGEEKGVNAMLSRCCQELVSVSALRREEELVSSIVAALSALKITLAR